VYYSSDAGKSFHYFASYKISQVGTFELVTFDLSSVAALDNDPEAQFRIVFKNAGSTSGNNRLNNVRFEASSVAEPSRTWLVMLTLLIGSALRVRDSKAGQ